MWKPEMPGYRHERISSRRPKRGCFRRRYTIGASNDGRQVFDIGVELWQIPEDAIVVEWIAFCGRPIVLTSEISILQWFTLPDPIFVSLDTK